MNEFRTDVLLISNEKQQEMNPSNASNDEQSARQAILNKGILYSNMDPLTVGEELRKGSVTVTVAGNTLILRIITSYTSTLGTNCIVANSC
jgi:hypothetical protein